jgi:8-oxo-dGTP diphosphatase
MTNLNPQIILPGRYSFVARTLTLLLREGEVLMQKAPLTKKIWAGHYNGIGGHVENGEDVLFSARRELREESGLECTDLHLCGIVTIEVQLSQGILMFVLSGSHLVGEPRPSEEGDLEWVAVEKLLQYPVVEDIPMLIEKIKNNDQIFFGHYSYDSVGKLVATFSYSAPQSL